MACSDWNDVWLNALKNESFRDAILCPYQTSAGGLFLGMIVYGAITTGLYLRTRSVLLPTVLTTIIGGALFAYLPGPVVGLFTTVLLFAVGLGPVIFIRRVTGP